MFLRVKLLSLFFLIAFVLITLKLFYWQVLEQKDLNVIANYQYSWEREIPAARGKIIASDYFPLVMNKNQYLLFADPTQIFETAASLKARLEKYISLASFPEKEISEKKIYWLPLAKKLDQTVKDKIESEKIQGIGFEKENVRFYPEASLSAHLLGFLGEDSDGQKKGYFGLEGYYDSELKGKSAIRYFEQDALGRPLPISEVEEEKLVAGRDLVLNIDRRLQFILEKRLCEGIEKYQAVSGIAVVVNPDNGAVLAMASSPAYDPQVYYQYPGEKYRNPVISSLFEPGSILKVITMASAIDSGAVKPNDLCPICNGPLKVGEYSIKTWNEKYYPNSSMTDVIVHSDNVGMVYTSDKMGKKIFLEYLEKFKFGEKTGIDLQGEVFSPLKNEGEYSPMDIASISFGQGIALTPIQVIMAVSALANKGELYEPQVVKSIIEKGKETPIRPKKIGNPISEKTAELITEMMVEAVEKGEAKWAKPNGYRIAGKTGTAQIPIAGHYDPEKTIASFVGYAPVDVPKFAMLVSLREPKTSQWGSETAAPLWFSIAKEIFRLWHIPPDTD